MYVKHPLIKENVMEKRDYQINIARKCLNRNCLVVLPTGLGKTNIAILVVADLLFKNPDAKILVLAPTKPLVAQHLKTFSKFLNLEKEKFVLVSGEIKPEKRKEFYERSLLIFATPQTIKNDLEENRFSLKEFSLVIFDEAHRAVGEYAYVYIAKKFKEEGKGFILGLTASPSSKKEKIEEIKKNLFIERVEVRIEKDKDVLPYIKKKEIVWVEIELPKEFKEVQEILKKMVKKRVEELLELGIITKTTILKKELLEMQSKLIKLSKENPSPLIFLGISKIAEILKIDHALTLLETQGISPLKEYLKELLNPKTKAEESIIKDDLFKKVFEIVEKIKEEHPKLSKLREIVEKEVENGKNVIVFAQYRKTVEKIVSFLNESEKIKAIALLGKKEGITQKKQIEVIEKFAKGEKNCLVCTSVGEEGLDIKGADLVVFYEPIPSEIRQIQRKGRVGRLKAGKIIFLITKNTRDESYYWSAFHKEKKMRKALYKEKKSSFFSLLDI